MTDPRIPITKPADLDRLDAADLIEGYNDGRANEPEPGGNRSYSYWHGYRNGRVDGGHADSDASQRELARDYLAAARS